MDGQQRVLSFLLLKLYLDPSFVCSLLNIEFANKVTQRNLHENFKTICEWFSSAAKDDRSNFNNALKNILEVVVVTVDKISEAFQLFDSQNSRGKALYPHDLLKAYHLREIHDKYEMQNAVVKWESKQPKAIRELFDLYLFPTLEETEGIPIMEACTAKIPALIRDIPVFSEWLIDGENVHKAKDIDEFEIKIKQILQNKLPNLTDKGYLVAHDRDIKKVGKKLINVYKQVMEGNVKE